MSIKIILIENERNFADTIIQYLESQHIECDYADNGISAEQLLFQYTYDVIVSDINMPRMDGFELIQRLRDRGQDTPVIIISALSDIDDKVHGFEQGADDFLVKPFALKELLIRIKALANRRSGQVKKIKLEQFELELNLPTRSVSRESTPVKVTPTGWAILEALVRNHPNSITKQALEHVVWGEEIPDSNALKVHIHTLRNKIDKPFDYPIIHMIPQVGFVLRRIDNEQQP
jgi:DNA-binding response OmpR family regulator